MEEMQGERMTLTVRERWRMPETSEDASREELGDGEGMRTTPGEVEVERQRQDLREMREGREEGEEEERREVSR